MRLFKKLKPLCLALALLIFIGSVGYVSPGARAAGVFPDVSQSAWYYDYVSKCASINVINGYPDGTFGPEDNLKRGEFLKLCIEGARMAGASLWTVNRDKYKAHWAGEYYAIALEENLLLASSTGSTELIFPFGRQELDKEITRYEMAVIISNLCSNCLMEKTVIVSEAESNISDYGTIPDTLVAKVEQTYGKGIITGFEDTSFRGSDTLTRAQASAVVYRLLWSNDRKMPQWASEPEEIINTPVSGRPAGFVSFAEWLRDGHINAYGTIDDAARIKLFGNANKTYFYSAADAAPYMQTVTVPIWLYDANSPDQRKSSSIAITVNKVVADEIYLIFKQIYDDPEKFPIYGGWAAGGARFTDTMRHAWGCAIDINSLYNCECNTKSGYLKVTCGYGYWPQNKDGTATNSFYAGSMSSPSIYSIGKNPGEYGYSVVKAFSDYGWGWGGNGWSGGTSFDYMHFSVLPSGG